MTSTIWIILGIATSALLAFYWNRHNAVWGGFTAGIILGLMIVIFMFFRGDGFNWYIIGKWTIVATLLGFGAELLGEAGNLLRKK